jgi:hypothetical protein
MRWLNRRHTISLNKSLLLRLIKELNKWLSFIYNTLIIRLLAVHQVAFAIRCLVE